MAYVVNYLIKTISCTQRMLYPLTKINQKLTRMRSSSWRINKPDISMPLVQDRSIEPVCPKETKGTKYSVEGESVGFLLIWPCFRERRSYNVNETPDWRKTPR